MPARNKRKTLIIRANQTKKDTPMFQILELKEQRELALKNAKDLLLKADSEQREMTVDEAGQYDQLMDEHKRLDVDIARRERLQSATDQSSKPEERKTVSLQPATPQRRIARVESVPSSVHLRSFKKYEDAHLMGKWLLGSVFEDVNARNFCLDKGLEFRAQEEGTNTKGGYLVPVQMENAIIDNRATYGVFRREVNPTLMSGDTKTVPVKASGLTAYFVGENAEITESTSGWTNVQLVAKKLAALAKYSSELNEDSIISLADDLANDMGMAFAEKEDRCGFLGDGTSTYGGMYGLVPWFEAHDASGEKGVVVAASGHDTYAEYDSADIGALLGALPAQYRMGAKLFMSSATWAAIFERLMVAAGGNTMQNMADGVQPRYLGYPVVLSEVLLASATSATDQSNKSVVLFGNLPKTSLMGDRRGITIKIASERFVEYDQIGIVGTSRFDIVNHNLGDTSVAGGMVSLQGE
jgi:HK97 family phage major capsid protein